MSDVFVLRLKFYTIIAFSAVFGFSALMSSDAFAQCTSGKITINAAADIDGNVDNYEVKRAQKVSLEAAWKKYYTNLEPNLLKAYMDQQDKINEELSFFIKEDFTHKFDSSSETIEATNCITVDLERFKTALNFKDEPDTPAAIASGEGSLFVTLFVARQASSEQSFDATRETNSSATATSQTSSKSKSKSKKLAKEEAAASGAKAASAAKQLSKSQTAQKSSVKASTSSTESGSTILQSNKTSYKIISGAAADGAMSQPLITAGYEAAVYEDVADECGGVGKDAISETFSQKEELGRKQRRSAFRAARECEATYFALGTMTADVARTHMSGQKMVTVRIQGTVFNILKRVPRRVADIPPAQYIGIGGNEDSARTNALTLAGKKAGETITKLMQEKGLR